MKFKRRPSSSSESAATFQHCNLVFGMKIPSSVWNVNQVLIQASGQVLGSRSFEQWSFCALSVESRYPQRLIYIRFCFFHFYVNPWPYKPANSATANDTLVISVLFPNQSHFLLLIVFIQLFGQCHGLHVAVRGHLRE